MAHGMRMTQAQVCASLRHRPDSIRMYIFVMPAASPDTWPVRILPHDTIGHTTDNDLSKLCFLLSEAKQNK